MNHATKKAINLGDSKIILIVVLAINLLLSLYVAFFKKDAIWLETLKTGGKGNFQLVQDLYNNENYKNQQTQTINQVLSQMGGSQDNTQAAAEDTQAAAEDTTATQTLDKAKIDSILSTAYYQGDKNAKIILIEYSDLICPFCKRHYNNQTLETVVANHPKDVALAFKNMPLVQLHPTAPLGAEGVACANKVGGAKKAFAFLSKGFQAQNFTTDSVIAIGKEIGLTSSAFVNCVKNGETKAEVDASIQEGNSVFGINGTPGNVVLNRETGKYIVIAGAYPVDEFEKAVATLSK